MKSAKSRGRIIGVMLLAQLTGLIVPFVLLHPMTTSDFLANAAAYSSQIKLAVLLLLANCALTICISILAYPIFREYSAAAALLLVSASVIMFALQAVDNAHLMSMLSLSQEYVQGGGPDAGFQTLSVVVRSARKWTHYSELLAIDSWFFALYGTLCRFPLVPRALALFGLATVFVHFTAIPLPLFLGSGGVPQLGVALAFGHAALALWLLVRGFEGRVQGEMK